VCCALLVVKATSFFLCQDNSPQCFLSLWSNRTQVASGRAIFCAKERGRCKTICCKSYLITGECKCAWSGTTAAVSRPEADDSVGKMFCHSLLSRLSTRTHPACNSDARDMAYNWALYKGTKCSQGVLYATVSWRTLKYCVWN
jgi:hypothetical protein